MLPLESKLPLRMQRTAQQLPAQPDASTDERIPNAERTEKTVRASSLLPILPLALYALVHAPIPPLSPYSPLHTLKERNGTYVTVCDASKGELFALL